MDQTNLLFNELPRRPRVPYQIRRRSNGVVELTFCLSGGVTRLWGTSEVEVVERARNYK
jgi:hypothetical protein